MIALVKEAEFANDLITLADEQGVDNGGGPVWTGEIYVDHMVAAFAAMGAGKHQWAFFKDMCDPRQCRSTCEQFKDKLRMDAWDGEAVDMPGGNLVSTPSDHHRDLVAATCLRYCDVITEGRGFQAWWLLDLSEERHWQPPLDYRGCNCWPGAVPRLCARPSSPGKGPRE